MRVLGVTVVVTLLVLAGAATLPESLEKAPETLVKAPETLEKEPEGLLIPERLEKPQENLEKAPEKLEKEPEKLESVPENVKKEQGKLEKVPEKLDKEPEKLKKEPEELIKEQEKLKKEPEKLEKVPESVLKASDEKPAESLDKASEVTAETVPEGDAPKTSDGRVDYSGTQIWRVDATKNPESLKKLLETPSVKPWMANETVADLVVKPDKTKEVEALIQARGLSFTVSIEDLQVAINEENPQLTEEELELQGRKGHRMTWQHYHRAEDINGFMDYVAQTYPDVCSVQTIGNSLEGRPLKVLKIAGRPGSPSLWVDGGIHAREWITSASVTYLINELVENRASYESWLSKVDLHILPLINPDGYEHTHIGDRLWRKNRRSNGGFAQCAGTDLNRNWGYKWGGEGASNSPCRETYRGSGPFSEPETNAVQRHILSLRDVKGYLTFHSYGQYILYPWGYGRFVPPDHADLHRVGQKIGTAMKAVSGLPYTVGASGATLYPASGGSDDWAKGTANIKYPYTVELRDTGRHGFVLPSSYVKSSGKEVVAAVECLAKEISQ